MNNLPSPLAVEDFGPPLGNIARFGSFFRSIFVFFLEMLDDGNVPVDFHLC